MLRHIHFKQRTAFEQGLAIQDRFVRAHLDYKKLKTKVRDKIALVESGNYEHSLDTDQPAQVSDYEKGLLQKLLEDMKPQKVLLTFEFDPVYTGGKREKNGAMLNAAKYDFKGAHYCQTSRGGQVTYHGPGQLVAYPILDLKDIIFQNKPLTVKCYVDKLEQSVIDSLDTYGIRGMRTSNNGVWVTEKLKIASVGVNIRRGVTSHGISLNVSTDLSYPNHFTMCGLEDVKTTSMAEMGVAASVADVGTTFAQRFSQVFGFEGVEHVEM